LEKLEGVHGVTPEVDAVGIFHGLSIRVNKDMDINGILEVIILRGLKIRMVDTKEPTLEDAFMAITHRRAEQPSENGGHGRRP